MDDYPENILQLNLDDLGGGAARVAWSLFKEFQGRGMGSWLTVGRKYSVDPGVFQIPYRPPSYLPWARLTWFLRVQLLPFEDQSKAAYRIGRWFYALSDIWASIERKMGREDFNFRGSWELLKLPPVVPDLLHIHNLHEDYFDLRFLPVLSKKVPVILTLHDAWLLSGHCAHSFSCDRWMTGCGACPDLSIPVRINRDATAYNWELKRMIFAQSRLYITTPSQWLMDKVQRSRVRPFIQKSRVIPNGVDVSIFHPGSQAAARAEIGISQTASVLFFVAYEATVNVFKDFPTLEVAVSIIAERFPGRELTFISLGGKAKNRMIGHIPVLFFDFTRDLNQVAGYYRAADIYIHAANADTFPNVILESMACGTPVIATAVGGIPEQISHGLTGYLTPSRDPVAMANIIQTLLENDDLRKSIGLAAADDVLKKFSLKKQTDELLRWYGEVTEDWQRWKVSNR